MFKSALAPLLVCFTTPTPEKYRVIFKSGDDLRQDCLVLNMINLVSASFHALSPPPFLSSSSSAQARTVPSLGHTCSLETELSRTVSLFQPFFSLPAQMDTLLKKVKLDLQLTPYRVLATGPAHGFVEFVPKSHTLTSILDKFDKDNPIRRFFEQHNQKPQTLAKVLDTFVKSCG